MTIYDEYIQLADTYRAKYGRDTVVLMQVGDFYELYAFHKEEQELEGADIYAVASTCNLVVTRKNKSLPAGRPSNPLLAGFHKSTCDKHARVLVGQGHTVVLVDQVNNSNNSGGPTSRRVAGVLSPATMMLAEAHGPAGRGGQVLMVVNVATLGGPRGLTSVGIAGVDVVSGRSFVLEAASSSQDPSFAQNELARIAYAHCPMEVAVVGSRPSREEELLPSLAGATGALVHVDWDGQRDFEGQGLQNELLAKAFGDRHAGMLSMIEVAGLERLDLARTAFAYMLQFAHDHNEALIQRLQLPQLLSSPGRLALEHNSAVQLNLVAGNGGGPTPEKPLLALLNRCCTAFGARLFRERLMAPLADAARIKARLDEAERLMQPDNKPLLARTRQTLRGVLDLERLHRRMTASVFHPLDWGSLHASLERVADLPQATEAERKLRDSCTDALDLAEAQKYLLQDVRSNIFVPGFDPELDALTEQLQQEQRKLEEFAAALSAACGVSGACTVTVTESASSHAEAWHLRMTSKRYKTAQQRQAEGVCGVPWSQFHTSDVGASVRVGCPPISAASHRIRQLQASMGERAQARYREFVRDWLRDNEPALLAAVRWLARLDVACTCAQNALDFGYCRPEIVMEDDDNGDDASSLHCTGMRHPIIERIRPSVAYVANDVSLRRGGLLLYGVNAAGKSSTMKAVGLNVIMAQAGMFVACSQMRLAPFRRVFTRISGADDIYRGLSSFMVEISELRDILCRADGRSLVLGDELCSGTETVSATSIVAAGIQRLSQLGACFIFATHIHELTSLPLFRELENVSVMHLHVETDPLTGDLVYHRQLRDGQGSPTYGLEVCRAALGMPKVFLDAADQVRRGLLGVPKDLVPGKGKRKSRYNAAVTMGMCCACNVRRATETHHIVPQKEADAEGRISPGLRKDDACNLAPLCERCHDAHHHGSLRIVGWQDTSRGRRLLCLPAAPAKI